MMGNAERPNEGIVVISLVKESHPVPIPLKDHSRTIKQQEKSFIPEPYKKVAQGMETQFLQYMLEQMNKTVDRNEELDSGDQFYHDLLTSERANLMAQSQQTGISDVVLDQIYPKRFRNQMALENYQKQQAPKPQVIRFKE